MNQTLNPSFAFVRVPRVALVAASWHKDIVGVAVSAIRHEFARCRIPDDHIAQFDVPGAF